MVDERLHLGRDVARARVHDVDRYRRGFGFTAKGTLDRKDFGLGWNQVLETGGVLVSDRVELELEVRGVRAAAAAAA
jgi:polyisoprenoid-binding protein YceI